MRSPRFLVPLVAGLAACAAPPVAPAPPAPTAPALAASPAARVFTAPPERCATPAVEPRVAPVFDDTAALSVKTVPAGIALDSAGATAGRVIVAVAEAARVPVHVEGFGASVRIYAHVAGMAPDALIAAVSRAAGLVTYRREGSEPIILDADEAEQRRRAWALANVDLAPIETRLVPAKHPLEIAAVLAKLVLPCRGEIVAAPERSTLMLRGHAGTLQIMEALVAALETQPLAPFHLELPARPPARPAEPRGCEAIAVKAAPDLPRGKLSSQGSAAGALLREIARKRGQDVVVGCGGERPAFFRAEGAVDAARVAEALGLARFGEIAYASSAMADRHRKQEIAAQHKEPPRAVHGFVVPGAAEVALAAERLLATNGDAVVYEPGSAVVVSAAPPWMRLAEELVEAWRKKP